MSMCWDLYRLGNNAGNARKAFNKKTFSIQNSHPFMVQCSENMCFLRFNFLSLFSFLPLPSILWTHRSEQWLPLAREKKKNRKYLRDCSLQFPGIYITYFFLGIHHASKVLIHPLFAHPQQKVSYGACNLRFSYSRIPLFAIRSRKVSYGGL